MEVRERQTTAGEAVEEPVKLRIVRTSLRSSRPAVRFVPPLTEPA